MLRNQFSPPFSRSAILGRAKAAHQLGITAEIDYKFQHAPSTRERRAAAVYADGETPGRLRKVEELGNESIHIGETCVLSYENLVIAT